MARFSVTAKGVATTVVAKTILQVLAPGTKSLHIVKARISLAGATAAAVPGDVDLLRQTTAGTSTAATPVELDEAGNLAGASAGVNFTVEPAAGDILDSIKLTPYGGIWEWVFEPGELIIPAGGRLGIRTTFAASEPATGVLVFLEV
jgi:hypothetical protein